ESTAQAAAVVRASRRHRRPGHAARHAPVGADLEARVRRRATRVTDSAETANSETANSEASTLDSIQPVSASSPSSWPPDPSGQDSVAGVAGEHPELIVGGAFAGGLVL